MSPSSRPSSGPNLGGSGEDPGQELGHVVVVGGSLAEWAEFDTGDWESRLATVSGGVASSGARWVTLMPRDGDPRDASRVREALTRVRGVVALADSGSRLVRDDGEITLVIDLETDGRVRFAAAVSALEQRTGDPSSITEEELAAEVLRPAGAEPDLVVILGPPDRLPPSLMWELAYSELVFLDLGWRALDPSHLEVAVEDYHRRNRRFGGLDS